MHTAFNASTSVLCMVRVERYSAIEVELGAYQPIKRAYLQQSSKFALFPVC